MARAWVASHAPDATLGQPVWMPMGYVFVVTHDGEVLGTVMVDDETGAVAWMGARQASPSPS